MSVPGPTIPGSRHPLNQYLPSYPERIAFGASNAMIFNTSTAAFALNFQRAFSVAPRIGLAVYTMDFEYSPTFSCKVTNSTTSTSAILQVTTSNVGQNNQLFLMYMATDHPLIGIFMPDALGTSPITKSPTI